MTIEDYKRLSHFKNIDVDYVDPVKEEPIADSDSTMFDILREIYSVDPISGLPKGDIQYYLSKDGNPDVKRWLETNLLQPRAISSGSSVEGITDDMIADFARRSDESVSQYVERMASIRDSAIADIEKFKSEQIKDS